MTPYEFMQKQSLPYEAKVIHGANRAHEFEEWAYEHGYNICVSIGGLDSITLYYFLLSIGIKAVPVTVSSLEDKSIQAIHQQIPGMVFLKPYKSKVQVLKEFGFPVISKSKASKIENLQKPDNPKQTFIHAIMTGDMGEQGKFQHSKKIKLPEKWIKLFGGLYNDHRPDLVCQTAFFKVSAECCKWMKEKPAQDWQKQNNMVPYLGLMASEGGQREQGLMKNGCNYYGKSTIRSCPFAVFGRQDLLQLAVDLKVPVPAIYGTIERDGRGLLYTTRAQRTGCSMCGFGIHIEKRPHRFDRLREDNPKEWHFWMYTMGWGEVLDYIGVRWEDKYIHQVQMDNMFEMCVI
ncbi:MAG: hypothetical protein WA118_08785 [Carboxydocellales bacterium]